MHRRQGHALDRDHRCADERECVGNVEDHARHLIAATVAPDVLHRDVDVDRYLGIER
jgi:hypothetical protein